MEEDSQENDVTGSEPLPEVLIIEMSNENLDEGYLGDGGSETVPEEESTEEMSEIPESSENSAVVFAKMKMAAKSKAATSRTGTTRRQNSTCCILL